MSRCRNCGNPAHKTQHCPRFGPWYPEPGKTAADYQDLAVEITNKVAADILAEHEGHGYDGEEDLGVRQVAPTPTSRLDPRERAAQTFHCATCNADPGYACSSKSGVASKKSHRARYVQIPVNF